MVALQSPNNITGPFYTLNASRPFALTSIQSQRKRSSPHALSTPLCSSDFLKQEFISRDSSAQTQHYRGEFLAQALEGEDEEMVPRGGAGKAKACAQVRRLQVVATPMYENQAQARASARGVREPLSLGRHGPAN